jgi:hypothetical protein
MEHGTYVEEFSLYKVDLYNIFCHLLLNVVVKMSVKFVGNAVKFPWADWCVRWFKYATVLETNFVIIIRVLISIKTLVMETASVSESWCI